MRIFYIGLAFAETWYHLDRVGRYLPSSECDLRCGRYRALHRGLDGMLPGWRYRPRHQVYQRSAYARRLAGSGVHKQWAIIKNGTDNPRGALSAVVGQEIADLELVPDQ